jgi:ribosomal protein L11 methyltransferase
MSFEPSHSLLLAAGAAGFGDGSHPSTRGVIEALGLIDPAAFTPRNACDVGAGAGLLSFAIANRFGCPVLAIEIDRAAFETLKENIASNDFDARITPLYSDGFAHPEVARISAFDLMVMNILPEPLLQLSVEAERHLASGGVLILAGIMIAKESIIIKAYQSLELEMTSRIVIGDWVTLLWQKL